jgi:predicted signal transduction protein with EAL and GGDEF domain
MKKADIALYQAKAAGRNQYKVFTEVGQKGLFDTIET